MSSANPPLSSIASGNNTIKPSLSSKSKSSDASLKKSEDIVSIYSVDSSASALSKSSTRSVRNIGKKIASIMLSLIEPPLDRDGMLINAPSKRGTLPVSDKSGLYKLEQLRNEKN